MTLPVAHRDPHAVEGRFEGAFETALGISVQDFYAAYDAMVESMVLD